jgi:hypothetical protein
MTTETESVIGVIVRQSAQVQSLCEQFSKQYNSKNNVKVRGEWGRVLQEIRDSELNPVNAKGEPVTGKDATALTFGAICKELHIPRSTAYHYIDEFVTVTTFPPEIQEAARTLNINLALDHVRAAYIAGEYPAKSNENEALGIVAKLKLVRPPESTHETLTPGQATERFREMVKKAFTFARDNKLFTEKYANGIIANLSRMDAETLAFVFEQTVGVKQQA